MEGCCSKRMREGRLKDGRELLMDWSCPDNPKRKGQKREGLGVYIGCERA